MPEEVLLVSWDIEVMYPSIDNKLGLEACRDALNTRSEMKPSTECILEAIKITLECNNSTFSGKHYLQIDGTAMGPKNACSYADISVSNIDKKVFCRDDIKPLCWGRYRDNIFSLWNQSIEKLMEFTNYLSSICPTIKFTVRFDHQKLEFLDVLVYKDKGTLHTTDFSKETDGHMYLLPSSAHLHSVSRNILYNVALRLRCICSTQEQFDNKCEEYKGYLLARGYNRVHIHKQFSRAKRVPRESTLVKKMINSSDNKVIFNLDYHPSLRNVGAIFCQYLPILFKFTAMEQAFNCNGASIMVGYRRHKNIKEILSPPACPKTKNSKPPPSAGCNKCTSKCYVCRNFLIESSTITSVATGLSYKIKDALSCKDDWVIYFATCVKCQKQDVGSTFTDFYTRWSNHKSHINKSQKTCTLAKHFIEKQCGLHNLKVTLVEKVKVKTEKYLEKREGHWQRQLFTMHPHGLNIRKEFENGTHKSFFN